MTKTITLNGHEFIPYQPPVFEEAEMLSRAKAFYQLMNNRRTVRDFTSKPIPRELVNHILRTASTAPSGAHKQPWTFCAVYSQELKTQIRKAAEQEEQENYAGRMPAEWLNDLRPLQTTWEKPFLEIAPCLIVVFKKTYDLLPNGEKKNNYYVAESVGLACGLLLAAIHHAGLVALTHTPSPMNFLTQLLKRPPNEKPFLLIPVGYPAPDTYVPNLKRKALEEFAIDY